MNRHEIESIVSYIEREVAEEYGLNLNYYGDCTPLDVETVMRDIQFGKVDEGDWGRIRRIYRSYAQSIIDDLGEQEASLFATLPLIAENWFDADLDKTLQNKADIILHHECTTLAEYAEQQLLESRASWVSPDIKEYIDFDKMGLDMYEGRNLLITPNGIVEYIGADEKGKWNN